MSTLADILIAWYDLNGRDLPWRRTRDPYRIWLSEVILQQTRVAQGMEYYLRFTERFPTVEALAAAEEPEVLKQWQGLGYYSRARNLHAAARQIVAQYGGRFPNTWAEVRALRGVGDYTAAAICSLAYDLPHAVVDGNVYRVLSRLFAIEEPIDTAAGRKLFAALAAEHLDPRRAARYNQAIMDFGALCCTPHHPDCAGCPLADRCAARAEHRIDEFPVKQGHTQVRDRWFHYLDIRCEGRVPLVRRGAGDIWQGLYELPLIETSAPCEADEVMRSQEFEAWVGPAGRLVQSLALPCHQLSHRRIHATVYRLETDRFTPRAAAAAVPADRLGDYAVPRLLERYWERIH